VVGGTAGASAPFVTEAEIAAMIALGRRTGAIDKVEGRMLTSVMELGETLVREVMVSRTEISALPLQAGWDEVMRVVREGGHSRLPVFDGTLDDIRGFIHTRDLLAGDIDPARFSLRRHLRPVEFVPELGRVRDLLRTFQRKKTHLAVVVDEFGGTAGIVALEDVLEEIVGPIQDEHDEEEAEITRLDDGHHRALGRASLYDLGEAIGVSFPEGGYDTIGGFLIARAGRMPRIGDRLAFGGHTFTVIEADERRVSRVDIERNASGGTTPPAPVAGGDIEAEEAATRAGADDT
jgi:CBS domain containing-hemolysin-like protein